MSDPQRNLTDPVIVLVDDEPLMNRFREVLADPVRRRMDYRTSCIKAIEIVKAQGIDDPDIIAAKVRTCRENCERLNLIVSMRDQYERSHPELVKAGVDGPDTTQFGQMDDFCKACIMAKPDQDQKKLNKLIAKVEARAEKGKWPSRSQARRLRKAGRLEYFPGNEEEPEEMQKQVPKAEEEGCAECAELGEDRVEASRGPELLQQASVPAQAEPIPIQARSSAAIEAPEILPVEKEDIVIHPDYGRKISETARSLRTGASRAKIYSEISRDMKKAAAARIAEPAPAMSISDEGGV